jgi:capsular polysaccharide biosynthesis protein
MTEVRTPYDDEIDLFELFETLWRGKWLISALVAISVLLGGGFLFITTPIYESKLVFSVETTPPFYENAKAKSDFKAIFYSKSMFDVWKSENGKSKLVYDDFDITEVINGFTFVKEEGNLLANIVEEKSLSALVVKTNKLSLLDEFFKYENFVNNKLTSDYVLRAKEELNFIETRFQNLQSSDISIVNNVLNIHRYIVSVERGSKVMTLNSPTFPKKISPKIKLTLAMSIVLGGMIGIVLVLVNNSIRKRKESASKV